MALNHVWMAFFIIGFMVGVVKAFVTGDGSIFSEMLNALFDAAKNGFEISLGLAGIMSLWLGIMKIGEKAGVIRVFARAMLPLFRVLFKYHPSQLFAYRSIKGAARV